ncbi:PDZ and LIM domain protein 5-like isoform X1 [Anguilla anguilla]|uniref:PDZ and LIM domain protein 5-like isoform X1 n=1 Tax=Anguilla anguilla TaxID=7936 RepID=UPI0015B211B9|nr:PDZ and LIM domain protein 5-like isoform X1 [Anguilla anguilla]
MSSTYSVTLGGPGPWGFRLQGGKDFCMPLTVSRLTDGGKASKAHISVGDVLLSIDGIQTNGMNHLEAQNKIKACTSNLKLTLQKASAVPNAAAAPKDQPVEVIKPLPIAQHAPPTVHASPAPGSTLNKTARPFGGGGGSVGVVTSSVSAPKVASIPSASSAFTPANPTSAPAPAFTSVPTPAKAPPPFTCSPATHPIIRSPATPPITRSPAPPTSTAKQSLGRSPFPPSSSPARGAGPPPAAVPSQPAVYNSPINLYSAQNASQLATGQRRGLQEGLGRTEQHNGSPRKPVADADAELHSPSHGDASRKRLVEDTEDWHPRSGTTQSRSFRILAQITGTEQQDGQQGEAGKNEVEVQPSAHVVSAVKTMTKAPAGGVRHGSPVPFKTPPAQGKPAAWKPGPSAGSGVPKAAPSFGRVSSSAPSARPAPQLPPGGQGSLVQRAEHIPAGTRTPLCASCNKLIRGPFLVALGKSWHPEEFDCGHCHTSLVELGFMEEGGCIYCERCYEEFFAPACAHCQKKIMGEVINALKQTWHVNCFLCASCKQPIRDNTFHLEDGQPYCEKDYYSLFATNCHGCDFAIEPGDKFLEALGWSWHDTCFVCAVCNTDLGGQAFYSKKDKALCKKHAHSVNI